LHEFSGSNNKVTGLPVAEGEPELEAEVVVVVRDFLADLERDNQNRRKFRVLRETRERGREGGNDRQKI